MTWKQDRILVFLESALNYNKNFNKRFYFDRSDKVFFHLYNDNKDIRLYPNSNLDITPENLIRLANKIEKLKGGSNDIIEIIPFEERFSDPDRGQLAKGPADFNRRLELSRTLAVKVNGFLADNDIDIATADVIEY